MPTLFAFEGGCVLGSWKARVASADYVVEEAVGAGIVE
tara:strand:+ start:399 stop:512 length:114 start_codon:yes stop_codon:yes gene_type:complete